MRLAFRALLHRCLGRQRSVLSSGYRPGLRGEAFEHDPRVLRHRFTRSRICYGLVDYMEGKTYGSGLGNYCESGEYAWPAVIGVLPSSAINQFQVEGNRL